MDAIFITFARVEPIGINRVCLKDLSMILLIQIATLTCIKSIEAQMTKIRKYRQTRSFITYCVIVLLEIFEDLLSDH